MARTATDINAVIEYINGHVDEVQALELLDLTTVEITEAFRERIAERIEQIIQQLEIEDVVGNTSSNSDD